MSFSWSSVDPDNPPADPVVTINPSGLASFTTFSNLATYPATITITATAIGSGVQGQTTLTVTNPVAHVVVTPDPPPATLVVCGTPSQQQFTVVVQDSSFNPLAVPVTWNSSKPGVATISNTGLATAVDGTNSPTIIKATAYGMDSNLVTLNVSGGASILVTVTPASPSIPAGSSDPSFHAAVTGSCTTCDVTWSVDDAAPPANGTVSPAGPNNDTTYTAPAAVPAPATVTVRATSTENVNCMGTADVTVIPTFAAAAEYDLGTSHNPQAIVMGQFNANDDGNLDIAVAAQDSNKAAILFGNGDGTLQTPAATVSTSGVDPVSLATGNFDGNGFTDLAVVNSSSDKVASLLGTGNTATPFTPASPATHATDAGPQSVATGDFDGDTYDDLAIANFIGTGPNGTLTILLSDHDGTFTEAPSSPITLAGSGPWAIAAGFFNGDANRDLAVADLLGDQLWIFLGNGDGTFTAAVGSPISSALIVGPAAIVIANFNGDANADIAIVNVGLIDNSCTLSQPANANTVTVLFGDGLGGFSSPVSYPVGFNPRAIATGDFNQDGNVDLVAANYCTDTVSLLFGNGDGTFQDAVDYSTGLPGSDRPTGVAVGDLDGDTFDDIAVSDSGSDSVSVLLNNN